MQPGRPRGLRRGLGSALPQLAQQALVCLPRRSPVSGVGTLRAARRSRRCVAAPSCAARASSRAPAQDPLPRNRSVLGARLSLGHVAAPGLPRAPPLGARLPRMQLSCRLLPLLPQHRQDVVTCSCCVIWKALCAPGLGSLDWASLSPSLSDWDRK